MISNKNDIQQIFGCLMRTPSLLSRSDQYNLSLADFHSNFERYIFDAINGLYHNGAAQVAPIDVLNYLDTNRAAAKVFESNNGVEYLQDALDFSSDNFQYYYDRLKKINLLRDCQKMGIDTKDFYCEDLTNPNATDINKDFEKLDIKDIIERIRRKVVGLEQTYSKNDVSETRSISDGLEDLMEEVETGGDIGLPLQGKIFNEVMAGARKGTLAIRSGSSGLAKTRMSVGDACHLAFPLRYSQYDGEWQQTGSNEKVLFIATEQSFKEIQRMVLAYLTGFNESRFRYGGFNEVEQVIVSSAIEVMERYKDNFKVTRMPNPTNELIKTTIRENSVLYGIEYVFYDYIFIGPALLNEFRGMGLRNDELLLILATTLKDLAVELDIFVMTSTQVNAKADDNTVIRNESSLAGGRATINKADYGFVMARPTKEELNALEKYTSKYGKVPNVVTDVFKVRAGQWTQVRIWSIFNAGTLEREDLFITDNRLEAVSMDFSYNFEYEREEEEQEELDNYVLELNERNVAIA